MQSLGFRHHLVTFAAALTLGLSLGATGASASENFELASAPTPIMGSDEIEVTIAPDGTAQEVRTRRIKVLTDAGRKAMAKQAVVYRSALQTVAVVEAYTEKRDGLRFYVDRGAILTRDVNANDVDSHDVKTRTLIFPNVAVGDTIVFTVRKETKKPIFPGQYAEIFPAENFVADTVRVIAPKDLWLNVAASGEDYEHRVIYDENTVTHIVTHPANPAGAPRPNENGAIAPSQSDYPHVLVSTFKDYWAIGRAEWALAKSRIEATPEITALANEITTGLTGHRAQAEAIDHWVKRNIRYVALEAGLDSMVPHRASAILRMRYGDCKDHAVLMASLLAVKGIASELVLIRVGNSYALPEPPYPGAFNHMMIYLPEFGMYDDPTALTAGFGMLMSPAYDQPTVRVSAKTIVVGRTPVMRANDHVAINHTSIMIAADGAVSGSTTETTTGVFAASARSRMTDIIDNKGLDDGAVTELRANGNPGAGLFEVDPEMNLAEPFVVKGNFDLGRVKLTSGMTLPVPVGLALMQRPGSILLGQRMASRHLPFVCLSGRQVEEIEITFAEGLPLPKPLPARKVANASFTFTATTKLENRTITVRREFIAHVPGQICAAEREGEIAHAMQDVIGTLRTGLTLDDTAPMLERLKQLDRQASAGNRQPL